MQCVRLFTFLLRCEPEAAIFVASKMAATIEESNRKNVNKSAHCIVVYHDPLKLYIELYYRLFISCLVFKIFRTEKVSCSPSWIIEDMHVTSREGSRQFFVLRVSDQLPWFQRFLWRRIINYVICTKERRNPMRISLLRRGLHEVSSEGKVSAQGVMGRAK